MQLIVVALVLLLPCGVQAAEVAAIFANGEEEHPAVWGYARSDFDRKVAELYAQGFDLVDLGAYIPKQDESERYNAVWSTGVDSTSVWAFDSADLVTKHADLETQGYRLDRLNAFVNGAGAERFNAVWVRSNESRPAVWGWARSDLDAKNAELQAQGYRLLEVTAYVLADGEGERYNAVWSNDGADRTAVWGWTREDFDRRYAELQVQGYSPTRLSVCLTAASNHSYNAVFLRSPGQRPALWGWQQSDFEAKQPEWHAQGLRLLSLNIIDEPCKPLGLRYNEVQQISSHNSYDKDDLKPGIKEK